MGDRERYVMAFANGSSAKANGILACDGIKSRIRRLLFGETYPCALPLYSRKGAYRALISMQDAVLAVGEEKAQNASMHVGIVA